MFLLPISEVQVSQATELLSFLDAPSHVSNNDNYCTFSSLELVNITSVSVAGQRCLYYGIDISVQLRVSNLLFSCLCFKIHFCLLTFRSVLKVYYLFLY